MILSVVVVKGNCFAFYIPVLFVVVVIPIVVLPVSTVPVSKWAVGIANASAYIVIVIVHPPMGAIMSMETAVVIVVVDSTAGHFWPVNDDPGLCGGTGVKSGAVYLLVSDLRGGSRVVVLERALGLGLGGRSLTNCLVGRSVAAHGAQA